MSEPKVTLTRHVYMDVIRIIGCILVILVHISAIDWNSFAVVSSEWKVLNIINSFGMSGVPLFFMISGALFLREKSNLSFKYVWKKILMVFLFYLFCLMFYNIVPFLKGTVLVDLQNVKVYVKNILYGNGIYHLWFLPILIVLYALSPILKSAFSSKRNCEYFLALFVVFGTVIPLAARYGGTAQEYMVSIQNRFSILWLSGQMGYFILGHYLHSFAPKLNRQKMLLAGGTAILIMILIIVQNYRDAVTKNAPSSNVSTPLSITCFIFVTCLFWIIKSKMEDFQSVKISNALGYLSSLTLGIYFIHPFLIENVLVWFQLEHFVTNYCLLTIARIIIVAVISGACAAVLRIVPLLKRIF